MPGMQGNCGRGRPTIVYSAGLLRGDFAWDLSGSKIRARNRLTMPQIQAISSESLELSGQVSRTYEKTHPWLSFELNLARFSPELWLLLGEARSKCEHLAGVPLRPDTARDLLRIYLAKGALATTAIEGNTLSMDEVQKYLDGKLHLPPSKEYLKTEIENIVDAYNLIVSETCHGDGLSVESIKKFNRLVLKGLEVDEEVTPGEFRQHNVGVARYRGAPWQDCPYLVNRMTEWLDELQRGLIEELGQANAILRAVVGHLYLAWIHPFGDGNGRTARLIEFAILVSAGVPVPAAHLLSDHYNETRTMYYRELDKASKSGGDIVPFITYAVRGFVDGLRAQIEKVREQQLDVAWVNYVHEQLPHHSDTDKRRRCLVFALTARREAVPIREVTTLTGELAQLYGSKTKRTLARDLNALRKCKLVVGGLRVKANTDLMHAFLATRARNTPSQSVPSSPIPKSGRRTS